MAFQGTAVDEPTAELERLLGEVGDGIGRHRSRVILATDACGVSDLFAPSNPATIPLAGALLWVLDPEVLVGSSLAPRLLQMLFRNLHTIGTRSTPPLAQFVYLPEFASAGGYLLAELVSHLGLNVRECDPNTGTVLVEVRRPDGVILSALSGNPFAPNEAADPYMRQINEEKDRAEEQGDIARLGNLAEQEREELARRLAPARAKSTSVTRATLLRRLLLEAHDGEAEACRALCVELLRRDIPLLVMVDRTIGAAAHRTWPDRGAAMPVYPDRASLMQTASDLGMSMESFAIAEMPPRDLFCWMGKQQSAVAINVFRDEKTPLYVWLKAEAVQALSEGKAPQRLS